jgi:hypothetical protein
MPFHCVTSALNADHRSSLKIDRRTSATPRRGPVFTVWAVRRFTFAQRSQVHDYKTTLFFRANRAENLTSSRNGLNLLGGRPLYEGDTIVKKLFARRDRLIPRLQSAASGVPDGLETVFQKTVFQKTDRVTRAAALSAAQTTDRLPC